MSISLPINVSDNSQRFEIEHGWEFLADRSGRILYPQLAAAEGWRPARVGIAWNVQFEDLRDYMGAAWYRTTIEVPSFNDTRHVLLKFGAVDYFCEVYLNGKLVGSHEGGYTPFSFDITTSLHAGPNELAIRVIDPPMNEEENRALFPEMMYNEIPHGKQNWYVQNAGIWQGVRLEVCPAIYLERIDVTSRITGEFEAAVRLAGIGLTSDDGSLARATKLRCSVYDSSGRKVFEHSQHLSPSNICVLTGAIHSPRLWGPDDPHLYVMEVNLEGPVNYRRRIRFGYRSFEARDGLLYLNGKPFYMLAALDQDFYPETIHTPASEEFVRDMMLKAKRLGINVLRCHLKVAHPVYLDVADEVGMLVWAEMPSWSDCWFPCDHFSMRAAVRGEQMFAEVMARDWNHPCIVIRTMMNESWGVNLKQEEQRKWLREAFERVKDTLKPLNMLVVDNSACEGNFHIKTDIEDFHQYYSMPDQVRLWDTWLAEFASRPSWTFSPYGDAQRTGDEPLVVSEFGNWGLPKLPPGEDLPWWFHYSFGGREVTAPSGVFERFREYKLDTIFRDYNDFAQDSQWHQYFSLKYEIESIRSQPSVQGYVVTAMTDVHWEVNGLLDMWRNPKAFAQELPRVQQPDVVIARPERWSCFAEDAQRARILVSHYSDRSLKGAKLRWTTESGASGTLPVPEIAQGQVADLGFVTWPAPTVDRPTIDRLFLDLRLANGTRLAENILDVYILPRNARHRLPAIRFGTLRDQKMKSGLSEAGYELRVHEPSSVLIGNILDDTMTQHVQAGGNAILLVDSADAFPDGFALKSTVRAGSELDGRWFSNFNWIRPDRPPFRDVAFSRILGFESVEVVPDYVIQGVTPDQFDHVLSGATYGWLQKNSALALQFTMGNGKVLATTYRFDAYWRDPYATALLDSFIQYVASDQCAQPLKLMELSVQ